MYGGCQKHQLLISSLNIIANWMLAKTPTIFSKVDVIQCSESIDVISISNLLI
jgi:hypothetical protein